MSNDTLEQAREQLMKSIDNATEALTAARHMITEMQNECEELDKALTELIKSHKA